METITKTYNVYKYSELSDKAKEKALDYARTHWSADTWYNEYEQLQYELTDAENVLVGIPTDQLSQYVQDLIKDRTLRDIRCTEMDSDHGIAKVEFTYNHDEDNDKDESRMEAHVAILHELQNFCVSFMRNASDYVYSAEYWAEEFETNERTFLEDGTLA